MKDSVFHFLKFNVFKGYLRLIHQRLLMGHCYTIGLEHLPERGERYFIVCNHQNTLTDPMNIVYSLPLTWHITALARANVFQIHPLITRFLHWIGLLPAFRMGWEGGGGLEQNFESFNRLAERANNGSPVIVFPEAGHTQGHYLDRFTTGAVRMAFYTAKANGWQYDVKIVPTAHHYEDYFAIRSDFVWIIGRPLSLQPYYKDYQDHPNSVMRHITRQLRVDIQQMMLDEGETDYAERDFLRRSPLNASTMQQQELPQQLESDKLFISRLVRNENYGNIISLTQQLMAKEAGLGIDDLTMEQRPGWTAILPKVLLLLLLLPLWTVCLWPHALCYALPPRLIRNDRMFTNSYRYVLSALLIYPLSAVVTLLTLGLAFGWWWQTVIWILLWIPSGHMAWWYYRLLQKTVRQYRYVTAPRQKLEAIQQLRRDIKQLLPSRYE